MRLWPSAGGKAFVASAVSLTYALIGQAMINTTLARLLSSAFNRYLALDPEAPEKMKALDGKLIGIELRGLQGELFLFVDDGAIEVITESAIEPDTILRGSPSGLFKLGLHRDSAPLFFSGEVEIRGDTRLGRQFKAVLADMEIDWEEHLSKFAGDFAAHRLVNAFDKFGKWSRSTVNNLGADIGEYLQEERRDVVSGAEIDVFSQQVDRLRDDVDRLEARIHRLQDTKK
jgi:ubiquinone biosynthesis protein UbiJ